MYASQLSQIPGGKDYTSDSEDFGLDLLKIRRKQQALLLVFAPQIPSPTQVLSYCLTEYIQLMLDLWPCLYPTVCVCIYSAVYQLQNIA